VREFFEQKAFGQTVDLSGPDVVKAMSTAVAHYVCVDVFSKTLKELAIAEQEPVLLEPERLLSTCQPFPWSRQGLGGCEDGVQPCALRQRLRA